MQKLSIIIICLLTLVSCKAQEVPTQFSTEALNDIFLTKTGEEIIFKDILKQHTGKTIVIDIWASWCRDCIKGMPKVKALQKNNPETVFLFLSLDKTEEAWIRGITKHKLQGEHYYMQSGWKGAFGSFLDLDWIPRYLVVDKTGAITVFRAIKANDKLIQEQLH